MPEQAKVEQTVKPAVVASANPEQAVAEAKAEKPATLAEAKEQVSPDAVYREMYTEMRRFRDYELQIANWHTLILTAILGAIFALGYGHAYRPPSHGTDLSAIGFLLGAVAVVIGIMGAWSSNFAGRRYWHLRKFMDNMEPSWKGYKPTDYYKLQMPGSFVTIMPLLVATVILLVLIFFPAPY